MQQEISDRIAAEIRERGEPLAAEDIARDYLRLTQAGPAALKLVQAMLERDTRFAQIAPGLWGIASQGPGLVPPVVLCAFEAPAGAQDAPWLWRIWTRLWGTAEPVRVHDGARASAELGSILADMAAYPVATQRPGLLRRWLGSQERIQACPECDPVLVDLRGWARLLSAPAVEPAANRARSVHAAVRAPGPRRARDNGEDSGSAGPDALGLLASAVEQIVAAAQERGLHTWRDVALAPLVAAEAAGEPSWADHWAFTREEIASLPEEPGVYRFFDRQGRVLYVGKSKNLRGRVGSYFRPFESGSSRRAAFLAEMHRLETETTGTELEALLCEAEQIRALSPTWNVQVGPPGDDAAFTPLDQDLVLLLPRADGAISLFVLGGERVAKTRIDAACDLEALREALRTFFVEGTSAGGLDEVPGPERVLVRRWLRWRPEGHTQLRLADFATFAGVVEAVGRALPGAGDAGVRESGLLVREGAAPAADARRPALASPPAVPGPPA